MRFFGLLSLEEFKPEQGKGWNARMYRTAYGKALFDVLWKLFWANDDDVFSFTMDSTKSQETCGILQPALSPFFPGWHKNLHLPDQDFKPGLYTFKISLKP